MTLAVAKTAPTYAGIVLYVKDTEHVFEQLHAFDAPLSALPFTGKQVAHVEKKTAAFHELNKYKNAFRNPFKLFPENTPVDARIATINTFQVKGHNLRKIVLPVITSERELAFTLMHAVKDYAMHVFGRDLVSVKAKLVGINDSHANASQFILVSTKYQTAKRIIVTQDNFQDVLRTATLGDIQLNNYNSECFGMSDLRLADASTSLVSTIVKQLVDTGNSPFVMVEPLFKQVGFHLEQAYNKNDFRHIEHVIPFEFELVVGNVYDICESIASQVKDVAHFAKSFAK